MSVEIAWNVVHLEKTVASTHPTEADQENSDLKRESGRAFAMVLITYALFTSECDQRRKRIYNSEATNQICNYRALFKAFYPWLWWVQVQNGENV